MSQQRSFQFFQKLAPIQQLRLVAAALVVLSVFAISALWVLHQQEQQARHSLATAQRDLVTLQSLVKQWETQRQTDSNDGAADLTAVLTQSLQRHGLQPSRLQQNGADEVQIRLDGVSYAQVIAWLADIEQQHSATINRASFAPSPDGSVMVVVGLRSLLVSE